MDPAAAVGIANVKLAEISKHCVNCCGKCSSEYDLKHFSIVSETNSMTNNDLEERKQIEVLDAIFYIFGLSLTDFTLRLLLQGEANCTNDTLIKESIFLCSSCAFAFKNVYDTFKDFKKRSHHNSLLWNTVNWKRDNINIKNEPVTVTENVFALEESDDLDDIGSGDGFCDRLEYDTDNFNNKALETDADEEEIEYKPKIFISSQGIFDENMVMTTTTEDNDTLNYATTKQLSKDNDYDPHTVKGAACSKDGEATGIGINKDEPSGPKERVNKITPWKVGHLDSLTGVAPIKCCKILFQSDGDFKSHAKVHHEKESEKLEQECEFCGKKILEKYLDFHIKVLHDPNLQYIECHLCPERFLTMKCLRKHKYEAHKRKPVKRGKNSRIHQCEICGVILKSRGGLNVHMKFVHQTELVCCDQCGKFFKNQRRLSRHQKIHEADFVADKEKFKCSQCGKILKHSLSLYNHVLRAHGSMSNKLFTCDICGKTTKNATNLKIHMKIHDPDRNQKHSGSHSSQLEVLEKELLPMPHSQPQATANQNEMLLQ